MWRVVGHPGAVRLLDRSLSEGRLAHAYLFTGPPHVGKTTLAIDLIAAVNCESPEPPCGACLQCAHVREGRHADVLHLGVAEEEGRKAIGIDAVRDAAHQANLNPFEGRYRAIIIEGRGAPDGGGGQRVAEAAGGAAGALDARAALGEPGQCAGDDPLAVPAHRPAADADGGGVGGAGGAVGGPGGAGRANWPR